MCDARGNIYFEPGMPYPADPAKWPVVRISADAKQVTTITPDSVPGFNGGLSFASFTVGLRGEVYVIGATSDSFRLITFDDEGQYSSISRFDRTDFNPSQLAAFPSGELLVSGERMPGRGEAGRSEPFTAIFDRNARLLSDLKLAGDVKQQASPSGNPGPILSNGAAVGADDGNIYLMRATERPLVLVISPGGEILRKLTLDSPGERFHGSHFSVAGGKIVMEFFKPNNDEQNSGTFLYSLFDAETGERQFDYEPTEDANGIFACYTPGQFTFLGPDNDRLVIVHAVP